MTTGLSYDGSVGTNYVNQIATLAVVDPTDTNYQTILPQMITYAENRIYRDLDFLFTSVSNTSYSLSSGVRSLSVPSSVFVVPQQVNVITPAGAVVDTTGTRKPLTRVTREYLDSVYGTPSYTGTPYVYAISGAADTSFTFLVGPYPDSTYNVEITGTFRPVSMSASTPTTFISLYLPDIFIMASMIYISAYQRNFGRANDDPQMAITYESQYKSLLAGCVTEEYRKKFEASAWSSKSPSPVATPTRG